MESVERRHFSRQMYSRDSELGRMKLQSVKENLYEATTKAVLYSIEMYSQKNLSDWARTDLMNRLDKANRSINMAKEDLQQGFISALDITNGCSVINDFVRNDSLIFSRNILQNRIKAYESTLKTIYEKEDLLIQRKKDIDFEGETYDSNEDEDNYVDFEDDNDVDDSSNIQQDEIEDSELPSKSEMDLFKERLLSAREFEEFEIIESELKEQEEKLKNAIEKMQSLTRNGKDIMSRQLEKEKDCLENLRTLRNTVFAHKNEDEQEISLIGTWEPEAGPLFLWASEIIKYIKTIEERYMLFSCFDEYYASKQKKDKFDGCKVYVQKQINELYVNNSNTVLEFAGTLFDKEDEVNNFRRLIYEMAINWDTGIMYLAIPEFEDLPEFNNFFKECLSGTNKYVSCFLKFKKQIAESYARGNLTEANYIYFEFLYQLNPYLKSIMWRGNSFSQKDFSKRVLLKLLKVRNMYQFDARLRDYDKYLCWINISRWCEWHLLSNIYFPSKEDEIRAEVARQFEDSLLAYQKVSDSKEKGKSFNKVIRNLARLNLAMGGDNSFTYTLKNGKTVHWETVDDMKNYMENSDNFADFGEISSLVKTLKCSEYFKIWQKETSKHIIHIEGN